MSGGRETLPAWRLRQFGIFFGFCVVSVAVLAATIKLSERAWRRGLRSAVVSALEEKFPGAWEVGEYVPLRSAIEQTAACYAISGGREKGYAVILRVQTFYGPFPAVFIYSERGGPEFVGFPNLHGRIAGVFEGRAADVRVAYWQGRLPLILKNVLEAENQ